MSTGQVYNADRLGIFTPKQIDRDVLSCGEVGWLVCAIKDITGAPVGDTLTGLVIQQIKHYLVLKRLNHRFTLVYSQSVLMTMNHSVMH